MRSLAGLSATLGQKVCRELLQAVHEWRPGKFFGTKDLGIAAWLNLDSVAVRLEIPRNLDYETIPTHREPCFLCGHDGALLPILFVYTRRYMGLQNESTDRPTIGFPLVESAARPVSVSACVDLTLDALR